MSYTIKGLRKVKYENSDKLVTRQHNTHSMIDSNEGSRSGACRPKGILICKDETWGGNGNIECSINVTRDYRLRRSTSRDNTGVTEIGR